MTHPHSQVARLNLNLLLSRYLCKMTPHPHSQVARLNLNLLLSRYLRKMVKHRREEDVVLSRDEEDEERRTRGQVVNAQPAHSFVQVRGVKSQVPHSSLLVSPP